MSEKWEIRYYWNENTYKAGVPAFKEVVTGDRYFVINWAQNKLKYSKFKFYDITKK